MTNLETGRSSGKNLERVMAEGLHSVKFDYFRYSFGYDSASRIQQGKKRNKRGSAFN